NRRQPAIEARGQQERMHNLRLGVAEISPDAHDVPRPAQPGIEAEHGHRSAGRLDLLADWTERVNAADERLEFFRQMPNEVEDHLLGAADLERVSEVHDTRATARHDET